MSQSELGELNTSSQIIDELKTPNTQNNFNFQPNVSYFETNLDSTEMEFLTKMMPRGYSFTNAFRSTRPRTARVIVDLAYIDRADYS